jgi:hypothetical protein
MKLDQHVRRADGEAWLGPIGQPFVWRVDDMILPQSICSHVLSFGKAARLITMGERLIPGAEIASENRATGERRLQLRTKTQRDIIHRRRLMLG